LDIHFTFETSRERATPLAEKNAAAGLSDFSQYVVLRGGSFLGKWRSTFAGSFEGKMNVQSACALNTRYVHLRKIQFFTGLHAVRS
jgi:hypothetical protein